MLAGGPACHSSTNAARDTFSSPYWGTNRAGQSQPLTHTYLDWCENTLASLIFTVQFDLLQMASCNKEKPWLCISSLCTHCRQQGAEMEMNKAAHSCRVMADCKPASFLCQAKNVPKCFSSKSENFKKKLGKSKEPCLQHNLKLLF